VLWKTPFREEGKKIPFIMIRYSILTRPKDRPLSKGRPNPLPPHFRLMSKLCAYMEKISLILIYIVSQYRLVVEFIRCYYLYIIVYFECAILIYVLFFSSFIYKSSIVEWRVNIFSCFRIQENTYTNKLSNGCLCHETEIKKSICVAFIYGYSIIFPNNLK
jgi:hypothetical protein